jgi:outer membrane protein OmpA-like peptidoglycan-associated protein
MTRTPAALILTVGITALGAACARAIEQAPVESPSRSQADAHTPAPAGTTLVVLLPDDESGVAGRAVVWNAAGRLALDAAGSSTTVIGSAAPSPIAVLSADAVKDAFADALQALPPAPRRFTLFFQFESEELTVESRRLVQQVMGAIKGRPVPDVVVIGHTDTTGTRRANAELGLKRARAVRALLVENGVTASSIEVASHGEGDLLIRTADGVFEPRNRRVDITVR